ncbi:COG3162 Predicted membrane protein [Mycobacteriaceae bacterium]
MLESTQSTYCELLVAVHGVPPPSQGVVLSQPDIEHVPPAADYLAVQASPEFQELRSRLRRFVFPTTVFFLIWYASYVLLGAFSHDFMATKVWGNINVGLLLGLAQFLTTFLITGLYIRFANRELDPRAAAIRAEMHWTEQ